MVVTLSGDIHVTLPFLRVFKHSYPLMLLGTDVLKPKPEGTEWAHTGMANEVTPSGIASYLTFAKGGE